MTAGVDYRRLFEAAHEAQVLLEPSGTIVTASDGYLRTVGKSRSDVLGLSMLELPPYAGVPAAVLNLREALSTMQAAALPICPVHLSGAAAGTPALWAEAKLQSIKDAAGRVEYIVHTLENAAGGRERSGSDSERRLGKLVEQTYDAVALFDAHGRIAYVSPAIRRVLGFTEHEFAALNPFENMHPDDRTRFGEELNRLFANPGGTLLSRFRAKHRDGHWCTLENAAVNRLHDPDIAAIVATFRNVSKEVDLEDELRRSSERLHIALVAARAISWDIDLVTGNVTYSSDFPTFFGIDRSSDYSRIRAAQRAVHPDDRDRVASTYNACVEFGRAFDVEYRGASTTGDMRWFASHGQISRDSNGQAVRLLGVTWDVSERQRLREERRTLEQRMQESQKLESLGVLAGGIAHDFSNLLMVILGNVSLLRRELGDAHPTLDHVDQMEEASRRATELCRQLLAYAGKGRFVLQHANLNQLIEDTMHLLQVSISKKAVLRFHLDPALPSIIADVTQVRQVLMNLVINASDAIGDQNGTISISTGVVQADRTYLDKTFLAPSIATGEYVFLEVSDTGSGMSTETKARIFEPFFSTKFTGRGLGLAAVLGIVRGHQGALKVYSELDKGSSFKFLLPAATSEPDIRRTPPARASRSASGTILVVDDEPAVRNVAKELLEGLGFRTLTASDGYDAVRTYQKHGDEVVCVLMDLTMPNLDGEETFRELRRIDPEVRVLLMSGYNEQDAIGRFVGKGVAGFIQKPFTLDELQRALHKLLGD